MSDDIPTAPSRPTPATDAAPELVEPAATEPAVVEPAVAEPAAAEPAVVAPVETAAPEAAPATATGEVAPAETVVAPLASPAAAPAVAGQVVYVSAPIPPKVRGNRVVGSLLAVVGAVLFAAVYGVVSGLIIDLQSGDLFGPTFGSFLGSAFFWVPGVVFLVGLVLLTLILNRAGWWAHVLGSLVLAIAVYFGMIGALLLIGNVFHGSPQPITFAQLAVNPWVIAAAIVAREVSIWIGLAIAARGRRVKARNLESRTAWDREQEEKKAEYAKQVAAA